MPAKDTTFHAQSTVTDSNKTINIDRQTSGHLPSWNMWYFRLRRPVQSLVLLTFILLPWINAKGWNLITGSLFSLDIAGIPLADPLNALQVLVQGYFSETLWLGAALVLLLALVLGRVFCGWICPYGLLSEITHAIVQKFKPSKGYPAKQNGYFFFIRWGICALGLLFGLLMGFPVLLMFSMPGELSLASMHILDGFSALLAVLALPFFILALEAVTKTRLWCRICPQAAFLSLAGKCFPKGFGIKWQASRCTCKGSVKPCEQACSLNLRIRQKDGPDRAECVQCGDCAKACSQYGQALSLRMKR